jgi:hypothetical protein
MYKLYSTFTIQKNRIRCFEDKLMEHYANKKKDVKYFFTRLTYIKIKK